MNNVIFNTQVSDVSMAMKMKSEIISGPTQSHGLPAFSWTGIYANMSHIGLPLTYDFDWVGVEAKL